MIDLAQMGAEINDAVLFGVYLAVALAVMAVLAAIADWLGEP